MIFLYVLIFSLPFYRHPVLDAGFGTLTVVKGIGAIAALCAFWHVALNGLPDYFETRQAKLFFAIFGITLFSFVQHGKPPGVDLIKPIFIYFSMMFFYFVIVSLVDTPAKLRSCLFILLCSIAFASLYVLREYQKYHSGLASYRIQGLVVGDGNYFSLAAMLAVPIGYLWFTAERQPFYRWSILALLLPTSLAIACTGSRGGLLALVAFIGFVIVRSRQRVRNALILSLLLFPSMFLFADNPIRRLFHPDYGDAKAVQFRLETWHAGLRMVYDHPLMGVGLGFFKPLIGSYGVDIRHRLIAHNTYLEIAAELGIVCLLLYLWMLWETYRSLEWTRCLAKEMNAPLLMNIVTGMQGGLIGFLVSSLFLSGEYVKFFWFYIFFSVALYRVTRRWALGKLREAAVPLPELVKAASV
jgi:O-antigen ligase